MIDEKVLIERLEEYPTYSFGVSLLNMKEYIKVSDLINIVNQLAEEHNNTSTEYINCSTDGWIPCSEELPPMPKENSLFENKPLELYLVSLDSADYPWRAFWNGKFFTDGFGKVEPMAWMPLPAPYRGNRND